MKKHIKFYVLFFSLTFMFGYCSPVLGAIETSLPDAKYFTPDMQASINTVSPVLHLLNWAAAIFGLFLIGWGIWKILRIVYQAFSGDRDTGSKELLAQLKPVGLGILIILFAITGLWYKVLVFLWTMIVPQVDKGLDEVKQTGSIIMPFLKNLS